MGSKHIVVNGREVVVPDELLTGRELKDLIAMPPGRNLVHQREEQSQLVADEEPIRLEDGDYFADIPTYRRGDGGGRLAVRRDRAGGATDRRGRS
jgi:hypothetical protein